MSDFGYHIDVCAQAIAAGQAPARQPNLSPIADAFRRQREELVTFLAQRVEHHSGGVFTIRMADSDLFQPRGTQYLRLVRCSWGARSNDMVTELDESMMLIFLGPYASGLFMNVPRASAEEVASRREARVQREPARQQEKRRALLRESARPMATDFLVRLTETLRSRLQMHGDSELCAEFAQETAHGRALTLEAAAYYAKATGVTIASLAT